jgi:hypothetical protein
MPVSKDNPIKRCPYSTKNVVIGARVGVVKTTNTSWNVFVWPKKPTTLNDGTNTWCDAA